MSQRPFRIFRLWNDGAVVDGEEPLGLPLDPRIPALRYTKSVHEILYMAGTYHINGNARRAVEYYRKAVRVCEVIVRETQFFTNPMAVEEARSAKKYAGNMLTVYARKGIPPLGILTVRGGLRTVVIPARLVDVFLQVWNEDRDCKGQLCGQLVGDRLVVTHLLIPDSTSVPMISLGWVHGHPQGEPFLSSLDVGVQYTYQRFVPEAVAIVCSPFCGLTRAFRLTSHGFLASFRPHFLPRDIYEEADHCVLDPGLSIALVDLRNDRNNP